MQTKIVRAAQQHGTEILCWQIANDENAKAKRQDVAKWVGKAWEEVSVESITNTWRSIGINAWDGA